jgi:phage-related protein
MEDPLLRPLVFVGGSRKEFMRFPREITRVMGFRLFAVQAGRQAEGEKPLVRGPLKGLGIRELRDDFDRDTYRVVYTVKLAGAIYVLHAFKKKSKFGISTPAHDIDLVLQRYHEAVRLDSESQPPLQQEPAR